jgi:hypothetical protein
MHEDLFKHSVQWCLVSAYLCTMINSATAGSFTRGCAARDLQVLMLIEEREDSNAVSADKLNEAVLSMLEARIVCYEGHVMDAMVLYDSIAQSITSETFPFSRHGDEMAGARDPFVPGPDDPGSRAGRRR